MDTQNVTRQAVIHQRKPGEPSPPIRAVVRKMEAGGVTVEVEDEAPAVEISQEIRIVERQISQNLSDAKSNLEFLGELKTIQREQDSRRLKEDGEAIEEIIIRHNGKDKPAPKAPNVVVLPSKSSHLGHVGPEIEKEKISPRRVWNAISGRELPSKEQILAVLPEEGKGIGLSKREIYAVLGMQQGSNKTNLHSMLKGLELAMLVSHTVIGNAYHYSKSPRKDK